jgi:hypothetical protein
MPEANLSANFGAASVMKKNLLKHLAQKLVLQGVLQ